MKTTFVGKTPELITFCKSHSHDSWEIVIPTKGHGIVETAFCRAEFSVGCAYVMPPHVAHWSYSDEPYTDIYMQVDSLDFKKNGITTIYGIDEMPSLGTIIYDAYLKTDQGYSGTCDSALRLIVQMIYDLVSDDTSSRITREIRNFLADNIAQSDISMTVLSEKFGFNGDYLRRIFKEDFGVTPMEYLENLRLSHAKQLLVKMPIYTVEEVGELCGFTDRFYFSRFFKRHTGLSPQKFRQSLVP